MILLAHYSKTTSFKGYKICQYVEDGTLNIKPGDYDLNWSYYNYPPLIKSGHFNGY